MATTKIPKMMKNAALPVDASGARTAYMHQPG